MEKSLDNPFLLRCARSLLEDGQSDQVFSMLKKIHPDNEEQENELTYLFGWFYHQKGHWDEIAQALTLLVDFARIEGHGNREHYSRREYSAYSLLWLGDAAINLRYYEDAARHYSQCLQIIHTRRLALHSLQIKAYYGLATSCTMRGLQGQAIQYYQKALDLCRDEADDEDCAHIYYGLCYTYRMVGKLLEACEAGKKALNLYKELGNRSMECQVRNLLGRIYYLVGDFRTASDYYTSSLAIATGYGDQKLLLVNYTALADLRRAEDLLEEATFFSTLALQIVERLDNEYLCGLTYLVIGKVLKAQAQVAEGEQKQKFLEKALGSFEKAKELLSRTQAYSDTAEVNWRLAQLLEELGRDREALTYWKSAYETEIRAKGLSLY